MSSLRKTIDLPLSKYRIKRLRLSLTPIICSYPTLMWLPFFMLTTLYVRKASVVSVRYSVLGLFFLILESQRWQRITTISVIATYKTTIASRKLPE